MSDNLHEVATHLQLGFTRLRCVELHAESNEVEHGLVLEDRGGLENCLIIQLRAIEEHLEHDMPRLMRFRKLNELLVGKAEQAPLECALVTISCAAVSHVELLDKHEETLCVQLICVKSVQFLENLVCLLFASATVHGRAEII